MAGASGWGDWLGRVAGASGLSEWLGRVAGASDWGGQGSTMNLALALYPCIYSIFFQMVKCKSNNKQCHYLNIFNSLDINNHHDYMGN